MRILRIACALALSLTAVPVWAPAAQDRGPAAAPPPSVDPVLRALTQPEIRTALDRAAAAADSPGMGDAPAGLLDGVVLDRRAGRTRIGLLVRLREPRSEALAELRAAGARIGTVVGDIATARVPIEALPELGRSPRLAALEAARRVTIEHDSSMIAIRVDEIRRRYGDEWQGRTGRGVLVGIYDTGIDYRHDDFRDAQGRTRVLGVWDQTVDGSPPTGFDYGSHCDRDALLDESCAQRDTNGHGTHVAGTAAGDGSAGGIGTRYRYAGAAPEAGILAVRGGGSQLSVDRIVEGVDWIFREADRLDRPAVVNLSLGTASGPRDGTTLFESALDALAGPGRVIVAAVGNEGSNGTANPSSPERFVHAMGSPAEGASDTLGIVVPSYQPRSGACNDGLAMELWYDGDDRYTVEIIRPNEQSVRAEHGQTVTSTDGGGRVRIDNASDGTAPNGDYTARIDFDDCAGVEPPASGDWRVLLTPTAAASGEPFHLWIDFSTLGGQFAYGTTGFDNRSNLTAPAGAREILAAGAFATRTCWPTARGTFCYQDEEQTGDLARMSSAGPTRDGRIKPDIVAPGLGIISVLSADANVVSQRIAPDGEHWVIEGTSMASPHLAGTVALMLQEEPGLSAADIRDIFARTAAQDAFTERTYARSAEDGRPSDWWGLGKLDARSAVEDLGARAGPVAYVDIRPNIDAMPVAATVALRGAAYDAFGAEVTTASLFWASSDPAVATVTQSGVVSTLGIGDVVLTASHDAFRDSLAVRVTEPATLVVDGSSLSQDEMQSIGGVRLPMLRLDLLADGPEPIDVVRIGFQLAGDDPGARLLLVHDRDGDARAGEDEPVLGSAEATLRDGEAVTVDVQPDSLRVPQNDTLPVLVALELSGAVPHGASFTAELLPDRLRSIGVRSGAESRIQPPATTIASGRTGTSVLEADEIFALSENPIRSDRVIFSLSSAPGVAAVYTIDGRRVRDLRPLATNAGRRIEWDLTNERGSPVAPGVYLLVFEVEGDLIREKLFVVRPAGGTDGKE